MEPFEVLSLRSVVREIVDCRILFIQGWSLFESYDRLVDKLAAKGVDDIEEVVGSNARVASSRLNLAKYSGYCYLVLVKPGWWLKAAIALGPRPTVLSMVRWDCQEAWDLDVWSQVVVSQGLGAGCHLELADPSVRRGNFYRSLLEMGNLHPGVLRGVWKQVVDSGDAPHMMSVYHTVGANVLSYDDLLVDAYKSLYMSPIDIMHRAVLGDIPAIVASVYTDGDFGYTGDDVVIVRDIIGKPKVRVPAMRVDAAYLLPPDWFYSGDGFLIGSKVKPTVLLVPAGYGPTFYHDVQKREISVSKDFPLVYLESAGRVKVWWDGYQNMGSFSCNHLARTQSNVLIHSAVPDRSSESEYVEISDPLDEWKRTERRRYSGTVSSFGNVRLGVGSTSLYTILSSLRSSGDVKLTMSDAVQVTSEQASVAVSPRVGNSVQVQALSGRSSVRDIKFSFHTEFVGDPYVYDCEYDSDMSSSGQFHFGDSFREDDKVRCEEVRVGRDKMVSSDHLESTTLQSVDTRLFDGKLTGLVEESRHESLDESRRSFVGTRSGVEGFDEVYGDHRPLSVRGTKGRDKVLCDSKGLLRDTNHEVWRSSDKKKRRSELRGLKGLLDEKGKAILGSVVVDRVRRVACG